MKPVLIRAATTAAENSVDVQRYALEDVMYRRHFNLRPPLMKRPSLHGLGVYTERPLSPIPEAQSKGVVIVIDPFTTGSVVAHQCLERGYQVCG